MKTVFGSVVYPQAIQWADEYVASLNSQTGAKFELLLINDGVNESDINALVHALHPKTTVIKAPSGLSISALRIMLLAQAKYMQADLLILGDFDDAFSPDRAAALIEAFDPQYTVSYHNLSAFTGEVFFKTLPREVTTPEEVAQYNFLGLTNTAVNMGRLRSEWIESLEEVETNVFDWYLFSRMLLDGHRFFRVEGCLSIYRKELLQAADISSADLENELRVKRCHYRLLSKRQAIFRELSDGYDGLCKQDLMKRLSHAHQGYWWEHLRL